MRSAYSEALPSAGWVYPFANHKGQFDRGYGQGTCSVVEGRSPYLTEPIGEQPTSSDPVTGQRSDEGPMTVCMEIDWPGRMSFSSGYRRPMWGTVSPWMGSLVYHGRDLSGQMYRRNRFYDPKTARFTQEDPIGIAGGLNVYGYANGDPISYSDPYGLRADSVYVITKRSNPQYRARVENMLSWNARHSPTFRKAFNAVASDPARHVYIQEAAPGRCALGICTAPNGRGGANIFFSPGDLNDPPPGSFTAANAETLGHEFAHGVAVAGFSEAESGVPSDCKYHGNTCAQDWSDRVEQEIRRTGAWPTPSTAVVNP